MACESVCKARACRRLLAPGRQELALSEESAAKMAHLVAENEIDGEVLGTFDSPQELCEHTGLAFVEDLARSARPRAASAPPSNSNAFAFSRSAPSLAASRSQHSARAAHPTIARLDAGHKF